MLRNVGQMDTPWRTRGAYSSPYHGIDLGGNSCYKFHPAVNTLYWLVTITNRHSTDAFLALYEEHGITVSLRTVGAGTAVRETLSTLGLEQTEKAVLFAMITAET